ncbi:MAG TPA: hypothetical protein VFK57_07305 [Vicinamibacterales bacterium]|nr:hypothetical protein [Vicinamibacterales bacterium]
MGAVLKARRWAVVLLVLLAAACGDLRVKLAVFNTAAEARSGGAFAAGWVPEGVPAEASDLRVGYMPDGRQWGVFAFRPSDAAAVRALTRDEITSGPLTCDPPGRLEFWPRVIRTPVDVARVNSTGFRLFHGADGRTYAINWGQGRAYYWK